MWSETKNVLPRSLWPFYYDLINKQSFWAKWLLHWNENGQHPLYTYKRWLGPHFQVCVVNFGRLVIANTEGSIKWHNLHFKKLQNADKSAVNKVLYTVAETEVTPRKASEISDRIAPNKSQKQCIYVYIYINQLYIDFSWLHIHMKCRGGPSAALLWVAFVISRERFIYSYRITSLILPHYRWPDALEYTFVYRVFNPISLQNVNGMLNVLAFGY